MRRLTRKSIALTLGHIANATTIDSSALPFNGYLVGYAIVVPTLDSGTVTLNIKDADGNVIYTKVAIAAAQTTFVPLTGTNAIPLCGNETFEIVTSASQTADRAFTVTPTVDSFI